MCSSRISVSSWLLPIYKQVISANPTFFLEKVTQLEERNFILQTDKEEKESQLEELSKTNQNLQSEIKELKDAMSQMGNETELNSNGMFSSALLR